jgi:two-component system KDP operon response regulator KdpE
MLRLIKLGLSPEMRVVTATGGADALRIAEEQRPDIAVLDWLMQDMDGLELMTELRERRQIPVIMLTAKDGDAEKVEAFTSGADDYLTKPFRAPELAARIRAVLRRVDLGGNSVTNLVANEVEVDLQRRRVTRGGAEVELSRTEWLVLQSLASQPGKLMTTAEVLSSVWGPEYREHGVYLRVWISRLRSKLEDDPQRPRIISTHTGIGYVFNATPVAGPALSGLRP